jgi:SHAQKYF class myb-like DNA-binding protein
MLAYLFYQLSIIIKMNSEMDSSAGKQGRWTKEEQSLFNLAFQWHGRDWKKLAEIIQTRTIIQIRSHAQKYCKKIAKKEESGEVEAHRVYVLEGALNSLSEYISNTCSNSYKKYMEFQQSLMYSQISSGNMDMKMSEPPIKGELDHS